MEETRGAIIPDDKVEDNKNGQAQDCELNSLSILGDGKQLPSIENNESPWLIPNYLIDGTDSEQPEARKTCG